MDTKKLSFNLKDTLFNNASKAFNLFLKFHNSCSDKVDKK